MTPEEQMRMSMAIQRAIGAGEQPPPGMISQSAVTPEMAAMASQDFSAAQGRLAQQQRMAQMLMQRSQDVPQGVQAGNVYVAGANPMTALAQALSGYQAGRTLRNMNEGYDDLERRMGETAKAKGQVAAIQDRRDADETASKQLERTLKLAADRDALAQKWAGTEPMPYVNVDNPKDTVEAWMTPRGPVVRGPDGNVPLDEKKYKRDESVNSRGAYQSNTTKNPTRWTNLDGDELYTVDVGGRTVNRDTGQPMPPGWIAKNGFFEEAPISESGRNNNLMKLAKDSKDVRMLAMNYQQMIDTFEKYGFDLFSEDEPLGRFEKDPGMIGRMTRAVEDAARPGSQSGEIYSATSGVLNAMIRAQAGLAQTQAEMQRIELEYGSNWMNEPAVMVTALARLEPRIKSDIAALTESVDDKTLTMYRDRLSARGVPDWTQWSANKKPDDTGGEGWSDAKAARLAELKRKKEQGTLGQ